MDVLEDDVWVGAAGDGNRGGGRQARRIAGVGVTRLLALCLLDLLVRGGVPQRHGHCHAKGRLGVVGVVGVVLGNGAQRALVILRLALLLL